jgi:hypothetical protein
MHKHLRYLCGLLILSAGLFLSCEKKNNSDAISPTFGPGGNPNPGYQTVTGSSTYTNPATENTSVDVGGPGWTNPTCGSTLSMTLKGYNGTTDVTLSFASVIKTTTYAVLPVPSGTTACALTVVNPPGQPAGIVWHGKSGTVVVNTSSAGISATFTNGIVCTQQNFSYPTVVARGALGCSQ